MNHPRRIVVIDDERPLLYGMLRTLKQAGYDASGDTSWSAGQRLLEERVPDLLLLDVSLPDANGIEQCRHLKTDQRYAEMSVALLSGTKIESDDQAEGLESGADEYMLKPIPPRELLARVRAILRLKATELRLAHALNEVEQANDALRKSEETARALLNATVDVAMLLTPDGVILEANQTAAEQRGYTVDDILGRPVFDFFPADVAESRKAVMQQVIDTGVPIRYEDAERGLTTYNSVYPIFDAQGRVEQVAVFAQDVTARKHTEEQLRKMSAAVEQSPNMLLITNRAGRIEYVNPQFSEITGYAAEEVLGKHPRLLKSGLVDEAVYRGLWQTIMQGRIWRGEWQNRKRDGDLYWESASISPIRNRQGDITHFLKVAEDISEKKQAEKALQASEAKLRIIVEHANVGIVLATREGTIQSCNPSFAGMLECAADELIGQHFRDFTHPDDLERELDLLRPILEGASEDYQIEKRYITRSETVLWVQANIACVRNQEGAVEYLIGIIHDITDRRRTQSELELSARRFRSVIETVGEGITLSDETGYFEIFNSKMEALTGYTKTEANSTSDFLACLYPDPADYHSALMGIQELRWTQGTRDIETTIVAFDGTRKTLLVSTSIIWRDDHPWFLSAYHDITDRKHAEEELAQATQAAEAARKAAELANQAKSEFLANMSHELRTPLNGILGYAQILKRNHELTHEQHEAVDIIQHSGDHLLTLLNDILDLSKIEAGKLEIQSMPFSLERAIHAIIEVIRLRAQQKGIIFTTTVAPDVPAEIRGDEKCLRQVLLNLLGNAVKFTPQGSVTLTIETIAASRADDARAPQRVTLQFTISDTGIGIPAEHFEKIFSPFEQVKDGRLYSEGTGLGLAISRRLVRMMGSELYVESAMERGSRFWFEVSVPVSDHDGTGLGAGAPVITGFEGEANRILVADDKVENRQVLKAMLEPLGFDVHEAVNGRHALERIWQVRPHIVLLDLFMPEVMGVDVAKQLRQSPDMRDLVILAVSASAFEYIRAQSLEAGCNDFLPKPIVQQQLFDMLARHADIRWQYETDTGGTDAPEEAPLPVPPRQSLQELHDFAVIGDIMGIRNLAREFEALHPDYQRFFHKIAMLARDLRVSELQRLIQEGLDNSEP